MNELRLSKCWLPNSFTQRTKTEKCVTEIVPFYYRFFNKIKVLCKGEKPTSMLSYGTITKREMLSLHCKTNIKNPILEGYKYFEYLNNSSNFTYQNVADHFGISKTRVSQMIALVTKLPHEIINSIKNEDENIHRFTERRLRPLTLLTPDEEKIERFRKIQSSLKHSILS